MTSLTLDQRQQEQVRECLDTLQAFITHQQKLLMEIEAAFTQTHYAEVITLSLNQIHAVLRQTLWVASMQEAVFKGDTAFQDKAIFQTLMSRETLPIGVHDGELYGAALKHFVIDQETCDRLTHCHERSAPLLREIFSLHNPPAITGKSLAKLATELFDLNKKCIQELEQRAEEIMRAFGG
jgi:hypothetical protein